MVERLTGKASLETVSATIDRLAFAETELGRMQRLAGDEVVSEERLDSAELDVGCKGDQLLAADYAVDAARHKLYIGGSNRLGSEAPWGVEYFGASHFVGPDGRLPPLDAPANVVIADLDLGALAGGGGSGWDLPRDARPEIYTA